MIRFAVAAAALCLAAVPGRAAGSAGHAEVAVAGINLAGKIRKSKLSAAAKTKRLEELDEIMKGAACTGGPFYICQATNASQAFGALAKLQKLEQDEAKAEAAAGGAKKTSKAAKKKTP